MSHRTITFLWSIAAILAALTFFAKSSQSRSNKVPTQLSSGDTLLETVSLSQVASVVIEDAEGSVNLKNSKDGWTVADRDGYKANFDRFAQTMRTLKEATIAQSLKAGPAFNERFGMNHEAEAQENHGTLVTFTDQAGQILEKVSVGKSTRDLGSGLTTPLQNTPSGKYIRLNSEPDAIYVVNQALDNLSADPKNWLKEDFIKVQKIKSLDLATPNEKDVQGWTFHRENETADFTAENLPQGRELDSSKTATLKNILSFARFTDVLNEDDAKALQDETKARQLVINTFDNFRYVLNYAPAKNDEGDTSAAANAEEFVLSVKVSAKLSQERSKPEKETEEEATKAGEAFSALQKTLSDKLITEQSFQDKHYLVSKWTLDAVNKGIIDFTKEAPQPEPAPSPVPSPIPNAVSGQTPTPATIPQAHASPSKRPVAVSEPVEVSPTQAQAVKIEPKKQALNQPEIATKKAEPKTETKPSPVKTKPLEGNNADALETLSEDDIKRIVDQARKQVQE